MFWPIFDHYCLRNAMDWIEYSGILFSILCLLRLFYAHTSIQFWHEAPWHSRGQRFDPAYLHHLVLKTIGFQNFFFVKWWFYLLNSIFPNLCFWACPTSDISTFNLPTIGICLLGALIDLCNQTQRDGVLQTLLKLGLHEAPEGIKSNRHYC